MRTAPENLATVLASAEFILRLASVRRKELGNFTFLNGREQPIAIHAASKWCEVRIQRKSAGYLAQLFVRIIAANTISVQHLTPFEESDIPSEQETLFSTTHGCE